MPRNLDPVNSQYKPQDEPIVTHAPRARILTLALLACAGSVMIPCSHAMAEKKKIEVISVSHEIKAPRDAASGQATGRRVHRPASLAAVKSLCASMPNCQIVGENASSVGFCVGGDCVMAKTKGKGKGDKVEYLKYEIKDVLVSSYTTSRQAPAGRPMAWTGVSGILSPGVMGAGPKPPKIDVPKPAKIDVPKVSAPAGNLGVKDIKVNTIR
jgi:type VI protein secretion system component Hcp